MPSQPISQARLAANRANAQKSTGPRTVQGKAAVSNNALKHGLRSERAPMVLAADASLPYEQTQFLETLEAFKQEFSPQGLLETRLVERLAQLDHRLQRAVRMETAHLEMQATLIYRSTPNGLPEDNDQTRNSWLSTLAFLKSPSATTLIAQYESRLSRDFARTLTQLRQAQKLRNQSQPKHLSEQTQAETPHVAPVIHVPDEDVTNKAVPNQDVPDENLTERTRPRPATQSSAVASAVPDEPPQNFAKQTLTVSQPIETTAPHPVPQAA